MFYFEIWKHTFTSPGIPKLVDYFIHFCLGTKIINETVDSDRQEHLFLNLRPLMLILSLIFMLKTITSSISNVPTFYWLENSFVETLSCGKSPDTVILYKAPLWGKYSQPLSTPNRSAIPPSAWSQFWLHPWSDVPRTVVTVDFRASVPVVEWCPS